MQDPLLCGVLRGIFTMNEQFKDPIKVNLIVDKLLKRIEQTTKFHIPVKEKARRKFQQDFEKRYRHYLEKKD